MRTFEVSRRGPRATGLASALTTSRRAAPRTAGAGLSAHRFEDVHVHAPHPAPVVVGGLVDGGVPDAADAGAPDAGMLDAGTVDAGSVDAGSTDAAAPAAAPAAEEAPCPVRVMDRATFLQQPGVKPAGTTATQNAPFGLTDMTILASHSPGVTTVPTGGGRVRIQPTTATLPPIRSIAMGAGSFREGDMQVAGQGTSACPTKRYPIEWVIKPSGAAKIVQGEQEHCNDFRFAFDISWRRFETAVNAAAAAQETFPSNARARQVIGQRVGVHPDLWFAHFVCLTRQSETKRDLRSPFSHTPSTMRMRKFLPDETNCTVVRFTISDTTLPLVGQLPSAQVIVPSECATPASPTAPSPRKSRDR